MKPVKLLGLAFLAILAINAIALTTSASAVLLTEFLPTPTAAKPVTFKITGGKGELIKLGNELKNTENLKCEKHKGTGELTTSKLGKGEITYEGCEIAAAKAPCESLGTGKPGVIVAKGTFHIQTGLLEEVIKKELKAVEKPALVLLPEPAIHIACGLILLEILQNKEDPSCIAGELLEPNKLLSIVKVDFKEELETKGDQDIRKVFTDEDKEYGCQILFEQNEGKLQDAAIIGEKELEIEGFKQGGVAITALIDF